MNPDQYRDLDRKVGLLCSPMTSVEADEDDSMLVFRWRLSEARRLGYDENVALAVAYSPHVDLHVLSERLIGRGCPLDLALEIAR